MPRAMTTNDFILKSEKIHNYKFDYSKLDYKKGNIKVCIICPIHGDFMQSPYAHLAGRGCNKCKSELIGDRTRKGKKSFVIEANNVHNNKYNYSEFEYKNNRTKSIIICPEHGSFMQAPSEHLSGCGCAQCGKLSALIKKKIKFVTKHPLYYTWLNIRSRCRDNKNESYNRYGAKGVNVSDEFYNSFIVFSEYLESLPNYDKKLSDKWSLDRIDTNGNYERGNLRWADNFTQSRNRNVYAKSGYEGIRIVENGIYVTMNIVLGFAENMEQAVNMRNTYIKEHHLPCRIQEYTGCKIKE